MDDSILFTEREILERIDEYALYCFYLQSEEVVIGGKTNSPVRVNGQHADNDPSFGVFERKKGGKDKPNEFMWKDNAYGSFGDIFDLVKVIYGFSTRREAFMQVLADFQVFGQSGAKPVYHEVPERIYAEPVDIAITSRPFLLKDLAFWRRFNITEDILNWYQTTAIKHYWIAASQKVPSYPKGLGFAYRIWDKYQLYFPYAPIKKQKFRHNYTEICVPGYQQLQLNSDLCIITKSMKDIMTLRSFGYEAVGVRSENTVLILECTEWLKLHYKRVLVLFDNDMKHKGDDYEFDKIYVPNLTGTDKDVSDFCDHHGPRECSLMLQQITGT